MIFGEIESGLSIWDRITKYWKNRKGVKEITPETIATRLVHLLASHGVHRNQIPRFIGHGLTVADVQIDEILLDKLTEELLDDVCKRLAVRREWLDGVDSQIYPTHNFYKEPERFAGFLDALRANNPEGLIMGVLIAPDTCNDYEEALIIMEEVIDQIGTKSIFRYHLCNNWPFAYWKGRAYLAACIAVAWKRNNYIHGIKKSRQFIQSLASGESLLGWNGEGIWELGCKTWDPEHMALRVDDFLEGLDPEKDNYGIKSGLTLWLDLQKQGLMDAGFGNVGRKEFEQAFKEYNLETIEYGD